MTHNSGGEEGVDQTVGKVGAVCEAWVLAGYDQYDRFSIIRALSDFYNRDVIASHTQSYLVNLNQVESYWKIKIKELTRLFSL